MRGLEFPSCLRQYGGKNAHKWLLEGLIDARQACKSSRKIGYKILPKCILRKNGQVFIKGNIFEGIR